MPPIRRYTLSLLLAVSMAGALLSGCAGAPLQEMSDARQAVRAAERAGAEKHAPDLLADARQLVERARLSMQKGEYKEAREDAERARDKAVEARRQAEASARPASGG